MLSQTVELFLNTFSIHSQIVLKMYRFRFDWFRFAVRIAAASFVCAVLRAVAETLMQLYFRHQTRFSINQIH